MLFNFFASVLLLAVKFEELLNVVVLALIFVLLGLIIFAVAFLIFEKITPFSVHKAIEEDQNVALGIVVGSIIIGIAIIIASAISG